MFQSGAEMPSRSGVSCQIVYAAAFTSLAVMSRYRSAMRLAMAPADQVAAYSRASVDMVRRRAGSLSNSMTRSAKPASLSGAT